MSDSAQRSINNYWLIGLPFLCTVCWLFVAGTLPLFLRVFCGPFRILFLGLLFFSLSTIVLFVVSVWIHSLVFWGTSAITRTKFSGWCSMACWFQFFIVTNCFIYFLQNIRGIRDHDFSWKIRIISLKIWFSPKNKIIKVSQNEFKITATAEFQIFHLLTELIIKFCNIVWTPCWKFLSVVIELIKQALSLCVNFDE